MFNLMFRLFVAMRPNATPPPSLATSPHCRERLDALEDAFLHMNASTAHQHAANGNGTHSADIGGSVGHAGTPKGKSSRRKLHLKAFSVLQKGWSVL